LLPSDQPVVTQAQIKLFHQQSKLRATRLYTDSDIGTVYKVGTHVF